MTLEELQKIDEAPQWMTFEGLATLEGGYLLPNETPKGLYKRLALTASKYLNKPELQKEFFKVFWNNWLCPASPVASNFGSDRGLPISCYSSVAEDSVDGIFKSYHETAMLSKNGGGCSKYWGDVRGRGEPIKGNGVSDGIIGWLKIEDQVIASVSQGATRRGAIANYLPIEHPDIEEFINIRRQTGDDTRRCRSIGFHHAVTITDGFMTKVENGDERARYLWGELLKARFETGEPYITFIDTANNKAPATVMNKKIYASNLCNEIYLPSDKNHTFVCCLSSINLARYEEWKDSNLIELAIYFLDAVMEEFIQKAKNIKGLDKACRFATKSRALGLGVLGWHMFLQEKNIPFDSFESMQWNNKIFKQFAEQSLEASKKLAVEYGEPEWCRGHNVRNLTQTAIAPTLSNSIISGVMSEGIQPIISNIFAQKTAKGTYIRKNPALERLLDSKNKNTLDIWTKINKDKGSVKNLAFLTKEEKELFKTAREINQFALIRQAGQRQKYIDQGQSLNIFFNISPNIVDKNEKTKLAKYIHDIHMEGWKVGLKGMYYLKTESALKGDSIYHEESECKACEG